VHYTEDDEKEYPAGERLIWRFTAEEKAQAIHKYWPSNRPSCSIREQYTTSPYRRVSRWGHAQVLDGVEE
jgi:transposase